jgi:GDP-L-fucose synthase
MKSDSQIFVAGHRGLVGNALLRTLKAQGFERLIVRTHAELDLTDAAAVAAFFAAEKIDYVFLAAAKVGGILANRDQPADFIRINLEIQTNVIHQAYLHGVKRLLFLGSSCIYPRDSPQPISESALLTGPLEDTNSAYALAKIAGIEMCRSYNQQYDTHYVCAMPTNLYGPGDNYDLQGAHVLPALLRKCLEAKLTGSSKVTVWGSGTPLREFLYSDDLAAACVFLMQLPNPEFDALLARMRQPLINIGYGSDVSITELVGHIARCVGFNGEIEFDRSKPDGTPRKLIDSSLMRSLGWQPKTALEQGLASALKDYLSRLTP